MDDEVRAWGMSQDQYERYLQSQIDQLTADNVQLMAEIDELQQVARKSYVDLQREYMILEKKYHDLVKDYERQLLIVASLEGTLISLGEKKNATA